MSAWCLTYRHDCQVSWLQPGEAQRGRVEEMQRALVEELLALRRDVHVHAHAACACDVCMRMRMCMLHVRVTRVSHVSEFVPKHADLACLRHHLQLPDEALREHATCCLVSPEHSSPALPRLLLLSALELWPASQQLLAGASHGLLCADLWLQLPWRAWSKMLKAFLAAPWLGRPFFSDAPADRWAAPRAQEESRSRSDRDEGLPCRRQRSPKLEISQSQHPGGSWTSLGGNALFK